MNERQTKFRKLLLDKKRAMWNELHDELFKKNGEELHSQFDMALDPADQGLIDLLEALKRSVAQTESGAAATPANMPPPADAAPGSAKGGPKKAEPRGEKAEKADKKKRKAG